MRIVAFSILVAATIAAPISPPRNGDCEHLLMTHSGPVCGVQTPTGGVNYLGIPYAAPPVGENRWKLPQPVQAWTEPRDGSQYGPGCVQLHHNPDVPKNQSEDCLSLNVFAPPATCKGPFPVAVWIHGGSFEEGGSSLFFYDGSAFASSQCIIVVNGNYRLGAFGGLIVDGLEGNQALHDQRAIMQWVQQNAQALNADAKAVTIWGQSAGAMSVGFHLSSPGSAGLFRAAIMQSNVGGYDYKTKKQATQYGLAFADVLGCKGGDLACMRNASTDDIKKAWDVVEGKVSNIVKIVIEWHNLAVALPFTPSVIGDADWPMQPVKAITDQKAMHVPIIIGSNIGDAILFVGCSKTPIPKIDYDVGVSVAFGLHSHNVLKHYPVPKNSNDSQPEISDLATDLVFRCPSRRIAKASSQPATAPAYSYVFNYSLPFNVFGKPCCDNQPCHGVEIPLVMHALGPYSLDQRSELLSTKLQNLWAEFIRSGRLDEDVWPAFDPASQNPKELLINYDGSLTATSSLAAKCIETWDNYTPFWDRPD